MARKISIQPDEEPVDVELWDGHTYETVPFRRKHVLQLDKLETDSADVLGRFYTAPNTLTVEDLDSIVRHFSSALDILVVPAGGNGKVKAGTLVLKKWKANEVSVEQIVKLFEDIMAAADGGEEEAGPDGPPTSPEAPAESSPPSPATTG
jgi:hypothetical protein